MKERVCEEMDEKFWDEWWKGRFRFFRPRVGLKVTIGGK